MLLNRVYGLLLLATFLAASAACTSTATEPGSTAAYVLDPVSANRDFQPPTPDDRLTVFATLRELGGAAVPTNLEPVRLEATLISSGEVWETAFDRVTRFEGTVETLARGGPRWPVGDFVRVAVTVEDTDGGPGFTVEFARVQIGRSE